MEVITSPVDVLAFEYVRIGVFTIVKNFWTWVAVITAAVSFWKIRNGASTSITVAVNPAPAPETETAFIDREADGFPHPSAETSAPASESKGCMAAGFDDVNGMTRGKFVVYFNEDRGDDGNGDGDGDVELTEWGNGDGWGEWLESWERVSKLRMGEMGWYRHQDLTVINGNVVRLWDGVRREKCLVW